MGERYERGDVAWGWVIKVTSLGVFVYSGAIRDQGPNFGVMLLAIAAAVFPMKDFRAFLRGWRNGKSGGEST